MIFTMRFRVVSMLILLEGGVWLATLRALGSESAVAMERASR